MKPPVARPVDPLTLLADARHPDPFSLLGPHLVAGGVVVRASLPSAERVDLVPRGSGGPVAMERRHPAGVFEGRLEGVSEIPEYRLRAIYPGWRELEIDDPFRFGRVLSD